MHLYYSILSVLSSFSTEISTAIAAASYSSSSGAVRFRYCNLLTSLATTSLDLSARSTSRARRARSPDAMDEAATIGIHEPLDLVKLALGE